MSCSALCRGHATARIGTPSCSGTTCIWWTCVDCIRRELLLRVSVCSVANGRITALQGVSKVAFLECWLAAGIVQLACAHDEAKVQPPHCSPGSAGCARRIPSKSQQPLAGVEASLVDAVRNCTPHVSRTCSSLTQPCIHADAERHRSLSDKSRDDPARHMAMSINLQHHTYVCNTVSAGRRLALVDKGVFEILVFPFTHTGPTFHAPLLDPADLPWTPTTPPANSCHTEQE